MLLCALAMLPFSLPNFNEIEKFATLKQIQLDFLFTCYGGKKLVNH